MTGAALQHVNGDRMRDFQQERIRMLALVLAEPAPTREGDEGGLMEILVIDMDT